MKGWAVTQGDGSTLLHRAGHPPVWSVETTTALSGACSANQRLRIAHQVRQDIWRANRQVRGFLPVVQVSTDGHETVIRAGGSLMTRSGHVPTIAAAVARVLADERNRTRWQAHARRIA